MSTKQVIDPFDGSSVFKKCLALMLVFTFISAAFGLDRSLTFIPSHSSDTNNTLKYQHDWETVVLVYYMCFAVNAFFGFTGLVYDKISLLISFSSLLFFLFIFGLSVECLRANTFGIVVQPITELLTVAYIYRLMTRGKDSRLQRIISVWTVYEQHMREDYI